MKPLSPLSALMMAAVIAVFCMAASTEDTGCQDGTPNSDQIQHAQQEKLNREAVSQVGMPAISTFTEKRNLKMIYELRDRADLTTYTYLVNELKGSVGDKVCDSIGYGFPYATQFTNPDVIAYGRESLTTLPQADPNGLFSPASADGTWIMCKEPNSTKVVPLYIEPKVIVSPFPLK